MARLTKQDTNSREPRGPPPFRAPASKPRQRLRFRLAPPVKSLIRSLRSWLWANASQLHSSRALSLALGDNEKSGRYLSQALSMMRIAASVCVASSARADETDQQVAAAVKACVAVVVRLVGGLVSTATLTRFTTRNQAGGKQGDHPVWGGLLVSLPQLHGCVWLPCQVRSMILPCGCLISGDLGKGTPRRIRLPGRSRCLWGSAIREP